MCEIEIGGEKIPDQEWEAAPESVKRALLNLAEQVNQLSERLAIAEEKLNQNSSNSSRPPSSDRFAGVPSKVTRIKVRTLWNTDPSTVARGGE